MDEVILKVHLESLATGVIRYPYTTQSRRIGPTDQITELYGVTA